MKRFTAVVALFISRVALAQDGGVAAAGPSLADRIAMVASFISTNGPSVLAAIAVLIGAVSGLVKALEGIVAILVHYIPSLKTTDGKLLGFAATLDALSKSKFLNTFALSPSVAFHASLNPPAQAIVDHAHDVTVMKAAAAA